MAKTKTKTVYKVKWANLTAVVGIIILCAGIIFGMVKGFNIYNDHVHTKKMIDKISEDIKVSNVVDDENTSTIPPDSTLSRFDSYWNYIKLSLLEVDMAGLKKINADSIGYIEVKGTKFSYPVVSKDDSYYKNHSFDRKENSYGWIYIDPLNNLEELDTNTLIYGNKTFSNVLFKNLNELYNESWNMNDDNFVIKFYTNYSSTLWQIVSVYKTKSEEHLKRTFESEEDLEKYIDKMLESTEIKFKADAMVSDKFLTLSTNSNGENLVVQAKLIKIKKEL